MANNTVNFTINVNGNAITGIAQLDQAMGNLTVSAKQTLKTFDKWGGFALYFNQVTDLVSKFANTLNNAIQPGIAFDAQMHELSAVTGLVGDQLDEIGKAARQNAKTFGGNAANSIESYKILLSQLDPAIAQNKEALVAMGEQVSILSKSMGGDSVAAAETLTTAMNQYGVSLENPIEASKIMKDMMNTMAAAAGVGSAELPQIKQALEQAGMSAKAAGVSFEETNAAIQVLDKAGKKGSEGGVALRNVMTTLAKGRFLPKATLKELKTAGVNTKVLTDESKTLGDRLDVLKPVLEDSALLTKLFGSANVASAIALIEGTETMQEYTEAITGTSAATEYADTVMGSFAEKQKRVNAFFDDLKISIFQATDGFSLYVTTIADTINSLAPLYPLLKAVGGAFGFLGTKIKAAGGIKQIFNRILSTTNTKLGLLKQTFTRITRSITTYIKDTTKALFTTATFTTSASVMWHKFANTVQKCCRKIGAAIKKIPIIGWIAAIVSAVIVAIKYFDKFGAAMDLILGGGIPILGIFMSIRRNWDNIVAGFKEGGIAEGFKQICKAIVEAWTYAIDQIFTILAEKFPTLAKIFIKIFAVWQVIKHLIGAIWDSIKNAFNMMVEDFKKKLEDFKTFWTTIWGFIKGIFNGLAEEFKKQWENFKTFWTAIGNFFKGIYNWIINLFEGAGIKIREKLQIVINFFKGMYNWLQELFKALGVKLREKLQPVLDFFSELWTTVKLVFSKIMEYAGKIFNPIIKLWNSLTGGSVEVYHKGLIAGEQKYGKKYTEEPTAWEVFKKEVFGEDDSTKLEDLLTGDKNKNKKVLGDTDNLADSAVGSNSVKNINISIDKIIGIGGDFVTNNVKGGAVKIADTIVDAIIEKINDINLAV